MWGHGQCWLLPVTVGDNTQGVPSPWEEVHPSFWCPEFLLGLNPILSAWLTPSVQPLPEVRLMPLVSNPSRGQNWSYMAPKPQHEAHCLNEQCQDPQGKQRQFYEAEYSRCLEITSQRFCGQKPDISLDKVNSSLDRGDRNCQKMERSGWTGGTGNSKGFLFSTSDITVNWILIKVEKL